MKNSRDFLSISFELESIVLGSFKSSQLNELVFVER